MLPTHWKIWRNATVAYVRCKGTANVPDQERKRYRKWKLKTLTPSHCWKKRSFHGFTVQQVKPNALILTLKKIVFVKLVRSLLNTNSPNTFQKNSTAGKDYLISSLKKNN